MIKRGAILSGQPVNYSHPLNQGLVGWWLAGPSFTGYGTPYWRDISGRHNHGTLTMPPQNWSADRPVGGYGSLLFDGTDDYVSRAIDLSAYNVCTVSMWLKCTFADTDDLAFEYGNTAGAGSFHFNPNDGGASPGNITVVYRGDVGFNFADYTRPSTSTWHHYTMIYDVRESANEVDLYIDGAYQTPLSRVNANNNTANFANETLYLMCRSAVNLFCPGNVADFRISAGVRYNNAQAMALYLDSLRGYPNLLNRVRVPVYAPAAAPGGVSPFFFNNFIRNRRRTA